MLITLSLIAVALDLVFGVLFGGMALSALDTVATASAEYTAVAGDLRAAMVLAGITDVALFAFLVWVARAVHRAVAAVRPLLVLKALAEAVVTVTFHGLTGSAAAQTTVAVLVGLLWDAVLLALLWLPESSRRFFGDTAPPATAATLRPPPSPSVRGSFGPGPDSQGFVARAARAPADEPATVRIALPSSRARHAAQPEPQP